MVKFPKDLNMSLTYAKNIRNIDIPSVRFKGLRLVPSRTASRELTKLGFDLDDCQSVLEEGYEGRIRSENTFERWLDSDGKTFNIVVVKSHNFIYKEDVYLITHAGKFTRRK
jgi:hypothetical protein